MPRFWPAGRAIAETPPAAVRGPGAHGRILGGVACAAWSPPRAAVLAPAVGGPTPRSMRGGIALPLAFSRCLEPTFPNMLLGSSSALHSACAMCGIGKVMVLVSPLTRRLSGEEYYGSNVQETKELHEYDNRATGTSNSAPVPAGRPRHGRASAWARHSRRTSGDAEYVSGSDRTRRV